MRYKVYTTDTRRADDEIYLMYMHTGPDTGYPAKKPGFIELEDGIYFRRDLLSYLIPETHRFFNHDLLTYGTNSVLHKHKNWKIAESAVFQYLKSMTPKR